LTAELVAYAEHYFKQATKLGGATVSDHWEQLKRQGVQPPESEELPDLPDLGAHVWDWFCELHAGRSCGMTGADPITWEAIDAWARRTDRDPMPWEVTAIKQIDAAWIGVQMEQRRNG